MLIRKSMAIILIICIAFTCSGCSAYKKSLSSDKGIVGAEDISGEIVSEVVPLESEDPTSAVYIVNHMKAGWNLGNTLENFNSVEYEIGIQRRDAYSAIASYSPKKYDVWNCSPQASFSETDGTVVVEWDLSSIKSESDSAFGSFGIQIFNWAIGDTVTKELIIEITAATIVMQDGRVIELEDLIGNHTLELIDGAAKFYPGMSRIVSTTGALMTGKLQIEIAIKEYLTPLNPPIKEVYYETLLSNPVTSKEMIDEVAAAGFGAVRIPITYSNHIDAETGLIDEQWLQRIKEVVNYVLDNNIYCIINIHHDTGSNGWLKASSANYEENNKKYTAIWTQVANMFKDYDNLLLFEGFNEILDEEGSWSNPKEEAYQVVNDLNQAFVETIRKAGGENSNRCLIINTYGALASEEALSQFEVPDDTVSGKLIVQVHVYSPQNFAWQQDEVTWEETRDTWGTDADKAQIDGVFTRMYTYRVSRGIPVILGEFGAANKSNLKERIEYTSYYVSKAREYGIVCFWWDVGGNAETSDQVRTSALLNRNTLEWYFPELVEVLVSD